MATTAQIERKAWQQLREHELDVTPVNVAALAEALDLDVAFEDMEDAVSAMLSVEDKNANIVVNAGHPENRQRFSIAHEIGHFMLHVSEDEHLFVDRAFYRDQASSVGESRQEIEANAYAAALLMPARLIEEALPDELDTELYFDDLAEKFEVSERAMTIRLIKLGYLDP